MSDQSSPSEARDPERDLDEVEVEAVEDLEVDDADDVKGGFTGRCLK